MYGGRVIDSFDRRILIIYMDEYLGDFIFDIFQSFYFFWNKEVDYKIFVGDEKDKFVGEIFQILKSIVKVFVKGDVYFSCFVFCGWFYGYFDFCFGGVFWLEGVVYYVFLGGLVGFFQFQS